MPKSKKRKKKGKRAAYSPRPEQQSGVTLQDLINVVAYQELVAKQNENSNEESKDDE